MSSTTERNSYIVIGIVGVLVALIGVVAFAGMSKADRREKCRLHLSDLLLVINSASPTDAPAWDRVATGRQFFLDTENWPTKSMRPLSPETFTCPVLGTTKPGRTVASIDYRGPSASVRTLEAEDVIAADRPGNHGAGAGGTILQKSGAVVEVSDEDSRWARASRTTSD